MRFLNEEIIKDRAMVNTTFKGRPEALIISNGDKGE